MLLRIATLAVLVSVAGCGSPSPSSDNVSNAKHLVDIWQGHHVSPSDRDVAAVHQHLTSLTGTCRESETTLTSSVAAALRLLKEHGVKESPMNLTAILAAAAAGRKAGSDCTSLLVAVLVQLESQAAQQSPSSQG